MREPLERRVQCGAAQLAGACWGPSAWRHHQGLRGAWTHLELTKHPQPGSRSSPLPSSHVPSSSLLPTQKSSKSLGHHEVPGLNVFITSG